MAKKAKSKKNNMPKTAEPSVKSEEQIQHEIELRTDLESSLNRMGAEDISPVLSTGQADSMAQVDRILGTIRKMEIEITDLQEQSKQYVDYNNVLIEKIDMQVRYLVQTCHQWMRTQVPDKKTVKGVNGTLKITTRNKVSYGDIDALIGWCKKNNVENGIRVKEELDKKGLNEYVKSTGDAPDEELYNVAEEKTFSIMTNKQDKE